MIAAAATVFCAVALAFAALLVVFNGYAAWANQRYARLGSARRHSPVLLVPQLLAFVAALVATHVGVELFPTSAYVGVALADPVWWWHPFVPRASDRT